MSAMTDTSPKAMRQFGLITGGLIILLFGLLLPWLWQADIERWLKTAAAIGGTLILWALLHPASLKWLYTPWMKFAHILGTINTHIILFLLFFLLFVPLGLIARLLGKDPMARRLQPESNSYRVVREPSEKEHMETPY